MDEKPHTRPSGRRYRNVKDLMVGEDVPQDVQKLVSQFEMETRVAHFLAVLRQKAGFTQEEMAGKLGCTQSAISKLENGPDEDITLKQIASYAKATSLRLSVHFGKPMNHVEAIKSAAFTIKDHLSELAKVANQCEDLELEIRAFFGEAFFNLLTILSECEEKMPPTEEAPPIRMKVIGSRRSQMDDAANSTRALAA